jgi:hypothetical protein
VVKNTIISNGAVVTSYIDHTAMSAPHTFVVIGQHGNERGPVLAAAGWAPHPSANLTIVRCANPYGFATSSRFSAGPGDVDINRGWGIPGTIADEIWKAVLNHLGRVPERVFDVHSSHTWRPGSRSKGMLVMTPSDSTRRDSGDLVVSVLAQAEDGWALWSPASTQGVEIDPEKFDGTLTGWACTQGAESILVEFPEDIAALAWVRGRLPGESVVTYGRKATVRLRTIHESMIGVLPLLDWIDTTSRTPA